MEKFLIIGGTGNIGFPLIERLAQEDIEIIAGVRHLEQAHETFRPFKNVEVKAFDFLEPTTFNAALQDVDRVFFVRPPQLATPKKDMFPFLEKLKAKGIKQVVFVSLIGVEKNPMTPHHKIEEKIIELELPHTFIRPSFFMQNLSTTHLEDIQKQQDLFVPAGNSKTSFIDTRDIAAVGAECLLNRQYLDQALEITGQVALTYKEAAAIMTSVLQEPITYSRPSLLKFRKTMLQRGIKKDYVNVMVMLYLITQLGNAKKITTTIYEVLGREPISFETFVKDYQTLFLAK